MLGAAAAAVPASAHNTTPIIKTGVVPLANTNEDIVCFSEPGGCGITSGTETNLEWNGGNVPYISVDPSASTTDFSEVNCVISGKTWCELKDSHGDCMNAVGSGTWNGYVVPSSCVGTTPEQWARIGVGSPPTWAYENRHFGTNGWLGTQNDFNTCNFIDPSVCGDSLYKSAQTTWSLPHS
jgi:hypothetical protein